MSGSLDRGEGCDALCLSVEMLGRLLLPLAFGDVAAGAAFGRLFIVCGVLGQAPVRRRGVPSIASRVRSYNIVRKWVSLKIKRSRREGERSGSCLLGGRELLYVQLTRLDATVENVHDQ
jgi:hypothetical protein